MKWMRWSFMVDPTRIYRARRKSDGVPVMLKTLRDECAAREAAAWLKMIRSDPAAQCRQRDPGLRSGTAQQPAGDGIGGFRRRLVGNLARQRRFPVEELLKIAIQLAQGLIDIHAANIIHKDINPSNIVYNPATGMAKIIDFGISTFLTREQAALASPQVFEGSLPYISPSRPDA